MFFLLIGTIPFLLAAGCSESSGVKPCADTDTSFASDGDADTDTDTDTDGDADTDTDTDGDADADMETDSDGDTDTGGDGDTDTDGDADTESDFGSETDMPVDTGTRDDSSDIGSDWHPGTDTDMGTETDFESEDTAGVPIESDPDPGNPPSPYGDILSDSQLRWLDNEMLLFVHFGIKTYYVNDNHMGDGTEDPAIFNPVDFDATQWLDACRAAGFNGVVFTAKHHDGFCNWPSSVTDHDVAATPFRGGQGDVVEEVVNAFRAENMWVGLYLSAYDRHYLASGAPGNEYNTYFLAQLTELCERYGQIDELWFDGFGADNMTVNPDERDTVVRTLQPNAVTFDGSVNPVQWTGNEACVISEPNWYGAIPYEADCIAQGNWFWNNTPICSLNRLKEIYRTSVALGATALINVAPNQNGLIDQDSIDRLSEFGDWVRSFTENDVASGKSVRADNIRDNHPRFHPKMALDDDKETYWATDDGVTSAVMEVELGQEEEVRAVVIQEYLPLGQRVSSHSISVWTGTAWREVASATTIGHKRVLEFTSVTTSKVRLSIDADAPIAIRDVKITAL